MALLELADTARADVTATETLVQAAAAEDIGRAAVVLTEQAVANLALTEDVCP